MAGTRTRTRNRERGTKNDQFGVAKTREKGGLVSL